MTLTGFKSAVGRRLNAAVLKGLATVVSASRRDGNDRHRSALVVPAASKGSLGDEAMLTVCAKELKSRGYIKLVVVQYDAEDRYEESLPGVEYLDLSDYFSDRVTLAGARALVRYLWECDQVLVNGADVLDGKYSVVMSEKLLRLAEAAAKAGAPTTITGFSVNPQMPERVARAFGRLPQTVRLCARDPLSWGRLCALIGDRVALTADLAFLLAPEEPGPRFNAARAFVDRQRRNGSIVVGFNTNPNCALTEVLRARYGLGAVDIYRRLAEALLERCPQLSLLFIGHDFRPETDDIALAREVVVGLPPGYRERCFLLPGEGGAAEIKGMLKDLAFVVTGRMHLAIGALSLGVPAATLEYQGKVSGLYRHLGLPELALDVQTWPDVESMAGDVADLIEGRQGFGATLRTNLSPIRALARANFELVPADAGADLREDAPFRTVEPLGDAR